MRVKPALRHGNYDLPVNYEFIAEETGRTRANTLGIWRPLLGPEGSSDAHIH